MNIKVSRRFRTSVVRWRSYRRPLNRLVCALGIGLFLGPVARADIGSPSEITSEPVPGAFLNIVDRSLAERRNVDQAFLDPAYTPSLDISQEANVFVTFIDEGAGYRNSLGWFSYQDNAFDGLTKGDIDANNNGLVSVTELDAVDGVDVGWVFPNASKDYGINRLSLGDTTVLNEGATFSADQNVSFFLGQNTYQGSISSTEAALESREVMYGLDFVNPEASADAAYGDTSDVSRHVAMLFADNEQRNVIMGFEDLNRTGWSDEDFNDAVFLVTTNPPDAIAGSKILPAPIPPLGTSGAGLLLVFAFTFYRRRAAQ